MSHVTNVLIWVSVMESEGPENRVPAIDYLNKVIESFAGRAGGSPETLVEVGSHAGGGKDLECYLFAAGINFLPEREFVEAFHAAPWNRPGENMLVICGHNDDFPRAFYPGHPYFLDRGE